MKKGRLWGVSERNYALSVSLQWEICQVPVTQFAITAASKTPAANKLQLSVLVYDSVNQSDIQKMD